MEHFQTFLDAVLTPEEHQQWLKISQKIEQHQTQLMEFALSGTTPSTNDMADPFNVEAPKHITDYDREVLIKVTADITTIDPESRMLKSMETRYEELYHIPIPSGVDYMKNLSQFFDTFENNINRCALEINKVNNVNPS